MVRYPIEFLGTAVWVELPENIFQDIQIRGASMNASPTEQEKYLASEVTQKIMENRGKRFNLFELFKYGPPILGLNTILYRLGYDNLQITLDETDKNKPFLKVNIGD